MLTNDEKISNCLICTLSERMKVCKACNFNVGLPFRAIRENERLSADSVLRIEEIRERFVIAIENS